MMSIYIIMSGLPGPLVAMAGQPASGSRRTLIVGSLMIVAGAIVMATVANSGAGAYLGFGVLVGGGVCTGASLAIQTALSRWFLRRRAMALSIMYSAGRDRRRPRREAPGTAHQADRRLARCAGG